MNSMMKPISTNKEAKGRRVKRKEQTPENPLSSEKRHPTRRKEVHLKRRELINE